MDAQCKCPKCGCQMEVGFMLELADYNAKRVSTWVAGEPEQSFWTGIKTGNRPNFEVQTFRCSECGYLESYAIKPSV